MPSNYFYSLDQIDYGALKEEMENVAPAPDNDGGIPLGERRSVNPVQGVGAATGEGGAKKHRHSGFSWSRSCCFKDSISASRSVSACWSCWTWRRKA